MKCSDRELVMELSRFVHNMLGNGFKNIFMPREKLFIFNLLEEQFQLKKLLLMV